MRESGAEVEEYKNKRVIAQRYGSGVSQEAGDSIALVFLEPGLVAVGSEPMLRAAIDLQTSGENVTRNTELMDLMRSLDRGNAWVLGRLDSLVVSGRLPEQVTNQLPAISWFSISGHVDSEIHGVLRADTRDDESASSLRDVVRGFVALVQLWGGSRPELQTMIQSLELGGTGKNVTLSFSISGAVFDAIGARAGGDRQPQ